MAEELQNASATFTAQIFPDGSTKNAVHFNNTEGKHELTKDAPLAEGEVAGLFEHLGEHAPVGHVLAPAPEPEAPPVPDVETASAAVANAQKALEEAQATHAAAVQASEEGPADPGSSSNPAETPKVN